MDLATLLGHIAARWDVEVFFADTKELLGLEQYQLMTTAAIMRFWTLVLAAYTPLATAGPGTPEPGGVRATATGTLRVQVRVRPNPTTDGTLTTVTATTYIIRNQGVLTDVAG